MVGTQGKQLCADLWFCNSLLLDSAEKVWQALQDASRAAGVCVVGDLTHCFYPCGVTGTVILEESHIMIHTWPREQYASIDFHTCGKGDPKAALAVMVAALESKEWHVLEFRRGRPGGFYNQQTSFESTSGM